MSVKHWALSLFFVWHLIAIAVAALGSSDAVLPVLSSPAPHHDAIAAALTPALDFAAEQAAPGLSAFLQASRPLQHLVATYIEVTGTFQSWKMFSNPPQVDQYLRVRYYVGPGVTTREGAGTPAWTATELVLPAHPEDRVRLFRGYWDAFRDKALTSALQRFHENRDSRLLNAQTTSEELPDDLVPVARYFAERFSERALRPDERILRTEVWYGTAPMAAPGDSEEQSRTSARLRILRDYYQGPIENHFGRIIYPAYPSGEQEADIQWFLEYFEP